MTKIENSLLTKERYKYLRQSIEERDQFDPENTEFRIDLFDYIAFNSYNDDDEFFYDEIEFSRMLDPEKHAEHIAFTDQHGLLWFNVPNKHVGKDEKEWEFIYCHECMHQLWDTFGVADKLKNEGYKVNHEMLNIASDIVINDYLEFLRNKKRPKAVLDAKWLKENFGVEYNRKKDTQYSLYLKLTESKEAKKIVNQAKQDDPTFGDQTIDPKNINKMDNPNQGGDSNGEYKEYPEEFVEGYTDAIKDVLDKKIDPLTVDLGSIKFKKNSEDYINGYTSAIGKIKEGLENGIDISSSAEMSGGGPSDNLPDIPWNIPPEESPSSNSSGDNEDSDSKKSNNSSSSNSEDSKDSSDQSSSSDSNGESGDSKENDPNDTSEEDKLRKASSAKEAAEKAQKAAEKAEEIGKRSIANSIENDKSDKDINKKIQDAIKDAKEHANNAKKAADKGDEETAKSELEKAVDSLREVKSHAESNDKNDNKKQGNSSKPPIAHGHLRNATGDEVNVFGDEDLEEISKKHKSVLEKYKNKISGALGDFTKKCKSSVKLEKNGLSFNTSKGNGGWDQLMDQYVNAYVKKKVFQKNRQYEANYKRVRRGSGFIKIGEPLKPDRRIREDKLTINIAFYVDRSGSMSGDPLKNAFKATYTLGAALGKKYKNEKVVDKCDFEIYTFDDIIEKIAWGKTVQARGGNVEFEEIIDYILKHTKDFLVNIVITDAGFEGSATKIAKNVNALGGILIFITNTENNFFKKIAKQLDPKMKYILSDPEFTLG